VAVKAFSPNNWYGQVGDEVWRRVAAIIHAGIASIIVAGEDAGVFYLVREFVPGRSLADLVPPAWPDAAEAVRLVVAIANALHYAHERGVVHGNLKPSNIILDPVGSPRLTDFHHFAWEGVRDRERYAQRDAVGFAYWSPEQVRGEPIDRRSDVYSLGVLLYVLLTGEVPFRTALSERPSLPPDLAAIHQQATAREPERRYQTAAEMAADLKRYLDGERARVRLAEATVGEGDDPANLTDEQLAELIAHRNDSAQAMQRAHQAFEHLYQRYAPRLRAFLASFSRSSKLDLDDLHQNVWVRIWNSNYHGGEVSGWLFVLARHQVSEESRYRKMSRRGGRGRRKQLLVSTSAPDPALTAEWKDEFSLRLAVLNDREAEVTGLRIAGYSTAEIARTMGLSTSTVRRLLKAVKKKLVEEESARPEVIIHRHTDISFPARTRVAKPCPLRVQIVPAEEKLPGGEVRQLPRPHPHDVALELVVPSPAYSRQPRIRVAVSVAAENFEIQGATRAEVDVPLVGKSPAVTFILRGQEIGPGRVMVDFSQDGQPVGSVDLFPQVVAADEKETAERARGRGRVEIGPTPEVSPDVVLKVFEHRYAGQAGRLHFVLSSVHPGLQDLPVLDGDLGMQDLRTDIAAWVEGQLRTVGAVAAQSDRTAEDVNQALEDVGHRLFGEVLPEKLQDLSWTLRERGVRSMLVLSDEPHIPWELIKPFRADPASGVLEKEDGCWGETFAVTRWLRGRPPARHFGLNRVFALAAAATRPDRASPSRNMVPVAGVPSGEPGAEGLAAQACLPAASEEIALLRSLQPAGATFVHLPARRRKLHEAFEQGGFDLLHLACHGTFGGSASADASAVLLEDGLFQAAELSPRMEGALRREAPLIFFNACHSGRLGFSPTGLGSWGARLVQMGCGGFIGSLWPVSDTAALAFARAFYGGLIRGCAIGEAVVLARREVRVAHPGDPTWLAYSCFADPMARLERNEGEGGSTGASIAPS
jgi:RNA polymerase sigma factor (sigma-70 family)